MQENSTPVEINESTPLPQPYTLPAGKKNLANLYEILEMLSTVTVIVMLCFAFLGRLNIVDGSSMDRTLATGEYLIVSDLFYTPKNGDIVVIHDITATPYDNPIVKRVIATEGQTVEIDFYSWTLKVDGEIVEEAYRYLDVGYATLTAEYGFDERGHFSITVPEGEVFVLGDNRNGSADSRQSEIRTIDTRCIVGRAYFRIFPLSKLGKLWE